jgi:hypothetical protein
MGEDIFSDGKQGNDKMEKLTEFLHTLSTFNNGEQPGKGKRNEG